MPRALPRHCGPASRSARGRRRRRRGRRRRGRRRTSRGRRRRARTRPSPRRRRRRPARCRSRCARAAPRPAAWSRCRPSAAAWSASAAASSPRARQAARRWSCRPRGRRRGWSRGSSRARRRRRARRGRPSRGCPARPKPSPRPTPLIAWIEHSAPAMRPSRRSSHETCEPRPGTSPKAITSKTPPSDSLALRWTLMCSTIARLVWPSRQRTGSIVDHLERGHCQRGRRRRRVDRADLHDVRADLDAERRAGTCARVPRRRRAPPSRARWRARARCARRRTCTSACRRGRRGRDAGGGPRGSWPRPATGSSAPPSWRSRGFAICSAIGPPSVVPWRTPAVTSARSRSIFIRPPRPWPSWRRAMSRLSVSSSSSRPAGRPSTMQVRPGPCDSPAVMRRSVMTARSLWRQGPAPGRAQKPATYASTIPSPHSSAKIPPKARNGPNGTAVRRPS